MRYIVQAACGCHVGKIRRNNEDNFYFDGKCLERENIGLKHPVSIESNLKNGLYFAVFDGIGGENFGEYASYAAARQTQLTERTFSDFFIPERKYLTRLIDEMNDSIVQLQQEMCTSRIGSTMVGLYFSGRYVYVCNVGDSRAYRLRDGVFLQISEDHVESIFELEARKSALTQYLGAGSDEMQIEPYIAKDTFQRGDMYLLCSDGLTDMLTNFEICSIMMECTDAESCVQNLVHAALEHGGRDNITVIICTVL